MYTNVSLDMKESRLLGVLQAKRDYQGMGRYDRAKHGNTSNAANVNPKVTRLKADLKPRNGRGISGIDRSNHHFLLA